MSNIEDKLQKLANRLAQEDWKKYDSRFISIVHTMQNNMQVSEIRKGGSRAKLTHVEGKGDLDILYTYAKTDLTPDEVFEKAYDILKDNFGEIAKITKKKVSVHLHFTNDDIQIDTVYLPFDIYPQAVSELKKIKEADKLKRDAIRLIRYWNEEANNRRIVPKYIEDFIVKNKFASLYDYICQYGEFKDYGMQIVSWLENKV